MVRNSLQYMVPAGGGSSRFAGNTTIGNSTTSSTITISDITAVSDTTIEISGADWGPGSCDSWYFAGT